MKHSLLCYVLGHLWQHSRFEIREGIKLQVWYYSNNCSRCGLSKEEVGISKEV